MGFPELAPVEQLTKQLCGFGLSKLAACVLNSRIKCDRSAEERFQRHRAGNMSGSPERKCIVNGECSNRCVCLRTVDESNPFFRTKRERRQPVIMEHVGRVTKGTSVV